MSKVENKKIPKSMGMKRVAQTKVGAVEKEYGIKLKKSTPNMNLSTYMEKTGLPEMARLLRSVEKGIKTSK